MIDLRSDTLSRPTEAMRRAIAAAPVGDDVYGEDPTVRALEQRTAALLGKEDAIYMVSGTMTNQVAVRTHAGAASRVLTEAGAHIFGVEGVGPAVLSGISIQQIPGQGGIFTAQQVADAIPSPHRFMPRTVLTPVKLVCVENTHNGAGGTIWPLDALNAVADSAHSRGVATHLDGARLWNAAVASGLDLTELAQPFDSVSVCFSKGLGAPVGSALVGSRDFVAAARRFKQSFGGGIRQGGLMAAGALHALDQHRDRLAEDHANARALAEGLAEIEGIEIDLASVQTNIVRFRTTRMPAGDFADACYARGVHLLPGGGQLRATCYIDIARADIDAALGIIRDVLAREAA